MFVSSATLLFISGRSWLSITVTEPGFPRFDLSMTGREVEPLIAGCAWALVTSVLALLVTRGTLQRIVGVIAALLGIVATVSCLQAHGSASSTAVSSYLAGKVGVTIQGYLQTSNSLWLIALICSLLSASAAVVVTLSVSNDSKLSSRYERSTEIGKDDISAWQALDEGLDPTADIANQFHKIESPTRNGADDE